MEEWKHRLLGEAESTGRNINRSGKPGDEYSDSDVDDEKDEDKMKTTSLNIINNSGFRGRNSQTSFQSKDNLRKNKSQ